VVVSINSLLIKLASEYYISIDSPEAKQIDASVLDLKRNLRSYFGSKIKDVMEFGSYRRDTILPAKYDPSSDVDLMVVFDRSQGQYSPATYLNYLRGFAQHHYSRSEIGRTSPSYTITLSHIGYDLVPAFKEDSFFTMFGPSYFIPDGDMSWQQTDPFTFDLQVGQINTAQNFMIKPLIRLLKAWNAKVHYPFTGYKLEKKIIEQYRMPFYYDNLQDLFFDTITDLAASIWFSPRSTVVNNLLSQTGKIKDALYTGNRVAAAQHLSYILPFDAP